MTSFIAGCGSGRSASLIPAVPAALSVTVIAFMELSPKSLSLWRSQDRTAAQRDQRRGVRSLSPFVRNGGILGFAQGAEAVSVTDQPLVRYSRADLDELMTALDVEFPRLSECLVSPGWRLELGGPQIPAIHYCLSGSGRLIVEGGASI